jgi:hypothetical protein
MIRRAGAGPKCRIVRPHCVVRALFARETWTSPADTVIMYTIAYSSW